MNKKLKFISSVLCGVLIASNLGVTSVYASEVALDIKQVNDVNEINKIAEKNSISLSNIETINEINVNSTNREKVYKELDIDKDDYTKLKKQGAEIFDEKIYVINKNLNNDEKESLKKNLDKNSRSNLKSIESLKTREVINTKQANFKTEDLTKGKSVGMRTLLDRSLTVLIGSVSSTLGNTATLLGVNPLDFLPNATSSDRLTKTQQIHYTYKYIQVSGDNGKTWFSCAKATHAEVTTYLDLYTVDKKQHSVRISKEIFKHIYSKYYAYENTLKEKALKEYRMNSGMSMYIDPIN